MLMLNSDRFCQENNFLYEPFLSSFFFILSLQKVGARFGALMLKIKKALVKWSWEETHIQEGMSSKHKILDGSFITIICGIDA